jgi:hypothetical protein
MTRRRLLAILGMRLAVALTVLALAAAVLAAFLAVRSAASP